MAVFRVAFGAIMLWEVCRYFSHAWIARYFIEPRFHFTYYGFGWVHPWPATGMYAHFVVLGVAALCVALGLWYRAAAAVLVVAFTYVFLLDEARYLNHFYAAALFALLLAVVPAHHTFSLDAWRRGKRGAAWSPTVPRWALWLLRVQVGVIYFFGGVAKLNADWLAGEPMRTWLMDAADNPLIALVVRNNAELYLFSYGGLLFDLCVVPALLWRRTRPYAFAAAIVFHVMNSQLFAIGIFPWMMIAATTLFFGPGWPRRLLPARAGEEPIVAPASRLHPAIIAALAAYVAVQALVPLRHFAYGGDVAWTEEGHRFSWRMKLRDKAGMALFSVTDPATRTTVIVDPADSLMDWQAGKMSVRPDMILQFAHFLADEQRAAGHVVQVRAQSNVSLNGHETRPLVNSTVDLAAEPRTLWPARWIMRGR